MPDSSFHFGRLVSEFAHAAINGPPIQSQGPGREQLCARATSRVWQLQHRRLGLGALRRHEEISGQRDMALSELVGEIDSKRQQGNLSSAIRLFVLDYFRTRAAAATLEAKPQG